MRICMKFLCMDAAQLFLPSIASVVATHLNSYFLQKYPAIVPLSLTINTKKQK